MTGLRRSGPGPPAATVTPDSTTDLATTPAPTPDTAPSPAPTPAANHATTPATSDSAPTSVSGGQKPVNHLATATATASATAASTSSSAPKSTPGEKKSITPVTTAAVSESVPVTAASTSASAPTSALETKKIPNTHPITPSTAPANASANSLVIPPTTRTTPAVSREPSTSAATSGTAPRGRRSSAAPSVSSGTVHSSVSATGPMTAPTTHPDVTTTTPYTVLIFTSGEEKSSTPPANKGGKPGEETSTSVQRPGNMERLSVTSQPRQNVSQQNVSQGKRSTADQGVPQGTTVKTGQDPESQSANDAGSGSVAGGSTRAGWKQPVGSRRLSSVTQSTEALHESEGNNKCATSRKDSERRLSPDHQPPSTTSRPSQQTHGGQGTQAGQGIQGNQGSQEGQRVSGSQEAANKQIRPGIQSNHVSNVKTSFNKGHVTLAASNGESKQNQPATTRRASIGNQGERAGTGRPGILKKSRRASSSPPNLSGPFWQRNPFSTDESSSDDNLKSPSNKTLLSRRERGRVLKQMKASEVMRMVKQSEEERKEQIMAIRRDSITKFKRLSFPSPEESAIMDNTGAPIGSGPNLTASSSKSLVRRVAERQAAVRRRQEEAEAAEAAAEEAGLNSTNDDDEIDEREEKRKRQWSRAKGVPTRKQPTDGSAKQVHRRRTSDGYEAGVSDTSDDKLVPAATVRPGPNVIRPTDGSRKTLEKDDADNVSVKKGRWKSLLGRHKSQNRSDGQSAGPSGGSVHSTVRSNEYSSPASSSHANTLKSRAHERESTGETRRPERERNSGRAGAKRFFLAGYKRKR